MTAGWFDKAERTSRGEKMAANLAQRMKLVMVCLTLTFRQTVRTTNQVMKKTNVVKKQIPTVFHHHERRGRGGLDWLNYELCHLTWCKSYFVNPINVLGNLEEPPHPKARPSAPINWSWPVSPAATATHQIPVLVGNGGQHNSVNPTGATK